MTTPAVIASAVASAVTVPTAFTITLFGPVQVAIDGKPLSHLRSRKALALLALLTLRHGRPVAREWLAGTLWPDADQEQAGASLRPVLSELRRALGDQAERLQSPSRHILFLDLAGADVDVLTFDAAILSKKLPALEQAVTLYQGPLLEGSMEEWAGQERDAREQDCLRALGTLAEAALGAGDYSAASGYSRRALVIAPWWEAARRGLMAALDKGGDSNGALQVYREFVELLKSDPRAAPSEETSAIYVRLRAEAKQRAAKPAGASLTGAIVTAASAETIQKAAVPMVRGHLAHPLTGLIGREDERLEVAARLRRSRLVTLTGPGGIGKTRLALEVAAEVSGEFDDGVCLVALESLLDGTMVFRQIAIQFGLKEEAARTCLTIVTEHLHAKRLLLVLDNCEHLLEDAARIAGHLLRECAGVRILATSREALGITGETAWVVPALAVPDPAYLPGGQATLVRVLLGYESVQLFIERAQAVQQGFALTGSNARTVAEVCARLEGIPLAIELAAARVKAMTVEQIAARLGDHLGLLTGGSRAAGLSRQQTLRATLDWSYDLLSEPERLLLRRLSVFAAGWSLDAAERVGAGGSIAAGQVLDLLTSLVDKSLVMFKVQGADAGGRYRLLETVRQYAAESLHAGGESEQVRALHAAWYLEFAEEAALRLGSPEQGEWLGRLEMEHDNLRVSLAWMTSDPAGAEANLRLTAALVEFWQIRGYSSEGRRHLEQALAREEAPARTAARGKALSGSASLAYTQGDFAFSKTRYEESLRLFKESEDKAGSAEALTRLGTLAQSQGDYTSATALHEEGLSLFRDAGDRRGVAQTLGSLGNVVRQQGNYPSARELIEESLSLFRKLGDWVSAARALNNLGNIVRLQGDYASAKMLYEEGLSLRTEMGDKPGIAWSLSGLGALAYVQEDFAEARRLHEESLKIRREFGSRQGVAWSLNNLGLVAQSQGRMEAAGALHRESLALFNELGDKMGSAWSINHLGLVARSEGEEASARTLLEESLTLFAQLGDTEGMATGLKELAAVLASQSHVPKAARLWGAAQSLRESIGAPLPANLQAKYHQEVSQASGSLDKESFAALWEEGRALTWKQASAYALTDTAKIPQAN